MASFDEELIEVSRRMLARRVGQRGRLPGARIRRSVSTTYYALFHFLLNEVGIRIVGAGNDLRVRRRILARTITHKGLKTTLNKIRGGAGDPSLSNFLSGVGAIGPFSAPAFAINLAGVFVDAQAKREDADYDLNKPLSETDARLLRARVKRGIAGWRKATTRADRDFKHALCVLILLGGQLRTER